MNNIELILWGIVSISIVGFIGCMISLVQEIKLFKLKMRLWEEEDRLRAAARSAMFTDFSKLLKKPLRK